MVDCLNNRISMSRLTKVGIEAKIHRWLSASFLSELVHYQILDEPGGRRLVFQVDHAALQELLTHRLGRTLSSPTASIGPPSRWWRPTPASKRSSKFFGASRKATG